MFALLGCYIIKLSIERVKTIFMNVLKYWTYLALDSAVESFFSFYVGSSKHERGWENSK